MRRFIATLPGKVVSQLLVLALVLPYLTLAMISRAEAQVQLAPQLAVTEFVNRKSPGTNFGVLAAQAFASEFTRTNAYEVLPEETVNRGLQSLGLTPPVSDAVNVVRLGQQLNVGTIVSGDIVDYEVRQVPGGRQAFVSMRVVLTDVASGLPVNGAAVTGQSTIRGGDVSEETLIADAIASGATQAVRQIQQLNLPVGTVMNTGTDRALVNQGTRSGFKVGQDVIFVRPGVGQVGSGRVSRVDPDQSDVTITNYKLGVQPGDRVRVLWTPPDVLPGFGSSGKASVARTSSRGINSGLVTTLLVVGLLAVLLSGSGGGSSEAAGSFVAEPTVDAGGLAANRLSWKGALFGAGARNYVSWQIWRDDNFTTPVAVVNNPNARQFFDTEQGGRIFDWTDLGQTGGSQCDFEVGDIYNETIDDPGVAGVTPGVPYLYSINAVYRVARVDLNDGGDGGNGGGGGNGTGGNTSTTGGTTAGTTGGTTAGTTGGFSKVPSNKRFGRQEDFCYFESERSSAPGTATPLRRPQLLSPSNNTFIKNEQQQFFFQSPFAAGTNVFLQYTLEFSATADFRNPYTVEERDSPTTTGQIGTSNIGFQNDPNIPNVFKTASRFYWRIGVRNGNDRPGPVPDPKSGKRYIYSLTYTIQRNTITPGTPVREKGRLPGLRK